MKTFRQFITEVMAVSTNGGSQGSQGKGTGASIVPGWVPYHFPIGVPASPWAPDPKPDPKPYPRFPPGEWAPGEPPETEWDWLYPPKSKTRPAARKINTRKNRHSRVSPGG